MGSSSSSSAAPAHHVLFLVGIIVLFVMFSWYMSYEAAYESVMDQLSLVVMASPVVILLAVHWLSAKEKHHPFSSVMPCAERHTIHKAGGSPWGVGFLLLFLMFMISYQSHLQDRTWFPIRKRSYY
ncbi:uncharacterized protein LOC131868963 [Cryptomeria japonica]|uniref:uncharacterized protein LOC131868963 n=1 Tax=Cryptomeria japonica TaxID=3369 RepID=UPI0027DA7473|nr:uncharacterized protein LOC131868963 [Cryptomeria japonica]